MNTKELRQAVDGKDKWTVWDMLQQDGAQHNVKMRNGYFGSYSLIDYKGKQAVVYIDDRDAVVEVKTDFHDQIFYGNEHHNTWNGDYRWNHDQPLVVYDKDKGYNLAAAHDGGLLCPEWLDNVGCKAWEWNRQTGEYFIDCVLHGKAGHVTPKGTFLSIEESDSNLISKILEEVGKYDTQQVIDLWINQDKPCAHIHGLEYKGARECKVTQDKALELIKTHHRFDGMFNSAEWRVLDGRVTLLFRDYANSDYD